MLFTFPAPLSIVFSPKTGETFVVPELDDIEDTARVVRANFEAELLARKEVLNEDNETQEQSRAAFLAGQAAEIARITSAREAVANLIVKQDFTLVLPDYDTQTTLADEAVRRDETTNEAVWDEGKYRMLLLKNGGVMQNGRVLSAQEVGAMHPIIAEELGARLVRALRPSDGRRMALLIPTPAQG